jgi:hypothetical protein
MLDRKVRQALHSFTARALMAATLIASAPGQASAADTWEGVGPARIGSDFEEISRHVALKCDAHDARKVCTVSAPGAILFDGLPVARIEAVFQESVLERVNISLATIQYEAMHRVLNAHFGPGEDRSFLAIAGMAAEFVAGVFVWRAGTTSLVLEQYAGKIDRSALSYGTDMSMDDLVRKAHAYPRGARRDL